MSTAPRSNHSDTGQGFALGVTMIAAILLLVAGVVSLFQGIAALGNDAIFVGVEYTYAMSLNGWGWIHIILGVIGIIVAFGMFTGATWARVCAIIIASLSIIANFLWIPQYPLWAILIIVLDIIVIWAVATWDSDRY